MRTLGVELFRAELLAQGVSAREHYAFVCPMCKTVQSAADLIRAGAGKTFPDVESIIGFSCVGRFTKAGPYKKDEPPGRGCDWTLGGLFRIHELEVIADGAVVHPHFEIATPAQAQEHEAQNKARPAT